MMEGESGPKSGPSSVDGDLNHWHLMTGTLLSGSIRDLVLVTELDQFSE